LKDALIYAVIFIVAFVGTTMEILRYNEQYVNIFEFDFRDAAVVALEDSLASVIPDSLEISETVASITPFKKEAEEYKNNYNQTKAELNKTSHELNQKEKEIELLQNQLKETNTNKNQEWLKSTIKLYEAMETVKAGQLLKSLPESEARELIYAMKKKKAAEILSGLDTETIKRLTRAKK